MLPGPHRPGGGGRGDTKDRPGASLRRRRSAASHCRDVTADRGAGNGRRWVSTAVFFACAGSRLASRGAGRLRRPRTANVWRSPVRRSIWRQSGKRLSAACVCSSMRSHGDVHSADTSCRAVSSSNTMPNSRPPTTPRRPSSAAGSRRQPAGNLPAGPDAAAATSCVGRPAPPAGARRHADCSAAVATTAVVCSAFSGDELFCNGHAKLPPGTINQLRTVSGCRGPRPPRRRPAQADGASAVPVESVVGQVRREPGPRPRGAWRGPAARNRQPPPWAGEAGLIGSQFRADRGRPPWIRAEIATTCRRARGNGASSTGVPRRSADTALRAQGLGRRRR